MNQQTEILELEITQEDIDRSIERRNTLTERICNCCVVSTAAQRQLGDETVSSAHGEIYLEDNTQYEYNSELAVYMSDFDNKRYDKVTPRKFILVKASY